MIIVHAADVHLGSPLRGLDKHDPGQLPVPMLRDAPRVALRRIGDLCRERAASLLIIAGDLFDGDAGMQVIGDARTELQTITAGGTRVVVIRGNHDAAQKMARALPRIDGVHELSTSEAETLAFDDLGVVVHGRGYASSRVTDNLVTAYPARVDGVFNIGVLHTSLEGNARHATYAPCSVDDLTAKGYDYWALGHIHQHAIVSDSPWIVYAGSPQGRHIGESGPHGVYVLELEAGRLVGRPTHVELAQVQWHRETIDITDEAATPDDVLTDIETRLADIDSRAPADITHVVRLTLVGRCAAHDAFRDEPATWRERILALANDADGMHFEQIRFDTQPVLPPADDLLQRSDMLGDFVRETTTITAPTLEALPPTLALLDKKLAVLREDADRLASRQLSDDDALRARDDLVARLLLKTREHADAERDA